GDYSKAIDYHKKAVNIAKETRDKTRESHCYANLGNAYHNLGNYTKDIEYEEKALEIKKEIGDKAGESSCYINLGNAYHNLGDYTKAIEYQEKALKLAKEIGDVYSEAIAQLSLGIIYNEQKPEMAYNNFKRSIDLTELIGGKIIEEVHRMGFYASHASRADVYQFMVPVCLRLDKDKEAFEYAERSKSKVFLYLLAASNLRPTIPIITRELKSLLDDEEKCLMMLRQIQTRHSRSMIDVTVNVRGINGASAVSPDNDEVEPSDYILSELNKIYDRIESIDPEYVFLRRGRPLSLDKIQNMLLQKGNNNDNATDSIAYFALGNTISYFNNFTHRFF
ncbi:MAG: tetratricopeptide repeat protein, partial [Candidatus Nitrosopolaris sp.]